MGKPSNIQNRATRKFKKISTAYQVLNEYLSEEDSDSEAEEKRKAEQDRRDREEYSNASLHRAISTTQKGQAS